MPETDRYVALQCSIAQYPNPGVSQDVVLSSAPQGGAPASFKSNVSGTPTVPVPPGSVPTQKFLDGEKLRLRDMENKNVRHGVSVDADQLRKETCHQQTLARDRERIKLRQQAMNRSAQANPNPPPLAKTLVPNLAVHSYHSKTGEALYDVRDVGLVPASAFQLQEQADQTSHAASFAPPLSPIFQPPDQSTPVSLVSSYPFSPPASDIPFASRDQHPFQAELGDPGVKQYFDNRSGTYYTSRFGPDTKPKAKKGPHMGAPEESYQPPSGYSGRGGFAPRGRSSPQYSHRGVFQPRGGQASNPRRRSSPYDREGPSNNLPLTGANAVPLRPTSFRGGPVGAAAARQPTARTPPVVNESSAITDAFKGFPKPTQ